MSNTWQLELYAALAALPKLKFWRASAVQCSQKLSADKMLYVAINN